MGFFGGPGAWLFPLSYVAHILEEWLVGERFYFWVRRITGRTMSPRAFFVINGIFLAAMTGAVWLVQTRQAVWLIPTLGLVIGLNGLGHILGAAATRTYSPGLVTGALLWMPLGWVAVMSSTLWLTPSSWWLGAFAGVFITALVFGVGFVSSVRVEPDRRPEPPPLTVD